MRRHVLAALAMLLIACGGDSATAPDPVSGDYSLRTVNGFNLPATFYEDEVERDEFSAGNLALASDHSWTGSLTLRATAKQTGEVFFNRAVPVSGTYALNNGSITLTDAVHALTMTGSIGGGAMNVGVDFGDGSTTSLAFRK